MFQLLCACFWGEGEEHCLDFAYIYFSNFALNHIADLRVNYFTYKGTYFSIHPLSSRYCKSCFLTFFFWQNLFQNLREASFLIHSLLGNLFSEKDALTRNFGTLNKFYSTDISLKWQNTQFRFRLTIEIWNINVSPIHTTLVHVATVLFLF